jgi:hypothetical protein
MRKTTALIVTLTAAIAVCLPTSGTASTTAPSARHRVTVPFYAVSLDGLHGRTLNQHITAHQARFA